MQLIVTSKFSVSAALHFNFAFQACCQVAQAEQDAFADNYLFIKRNRQRYINVRQEVTDAA